MARPPNLGCVQRLLSLFPHGHAGIGLILLRCAVGTGLALLDPAALPWAQTGIAYFVAGVMVLALLAGLLTRWVAMICCFAAIAQLHDLEFTLAILPPLAFGLCAAALMLLGPGAYSMDAMLFGRRVVKIPH